MFCGLLGAGTLRTVTPLLGPWWDFCGTGVGVCAYVVAVATAANSAAIHRLSPNLTAVRIPLTRTRHSSFCFPVRLRFLAPFGRLGDRRNALVGFIRIVATICGARYLVGAFRVSVGR